MSLINCVLLYVCVCIPVHGTTHAYHTAYFDGEHILYRWREESKTLTQKFEHTIAQLR